MTLKHAAAVIALHRAEPELTCNAIARRLGITHSAVAHVAMKHGLHMPNAQQAAAAEKELRSRTSIRAENARLAAKTRRLMGRE